MATKIRIELDTDGIMELLLSPEVSECCHVAAEQIAERAGDGFEVVGPQQLGRAKRAGWGVVAATYDAMLEEAEFKTLTKAVR